MCDHQCAPIRGISVCRCHGDCWIPLFFVEDFCMMNVFPPSEIILMILITAAFLLRLCPLLLTDNLFAYYWSEIYLQVILCEIFRTKIRTTSSTSESLLKTVLICHLTNSKHFCGDCIYVHNVCMSCTYMWDHWRTFVCMMNVFRPSEIILMILITAAFLLRLRPLLLTDNLFAYYWSEIYLQVILWDVSDQNTNDCICERKTIEDWPGMSFNK